MRVRGAEEGAVRSTATGMIAAVKFPARNIPLPRLALLIPALRTLEVRALEVRTFATWMRATSRLALLATVLAALSACALPRAGPERHEITAPAPATLPYQVVRVTAAIAAATRIDERRGFPASFRTAAPVAADTLAPGDVVRVTIWEGPDGGLLTSQDGAARPLPEMRVDASGYISIPYAGRLRAAGRSPTALAAAIRARLAHQTLAPEVDVFRVRAAGRMVSVQGRVRKPGLYPIEPPSSRILPMLARAGGVGEDPEVIMLRLRRGRETGEVWVQDLYDDPANNVALRPGDALVAERDRRSFTALGSVGRQATVPFPRRELPVAEALGTVGGLVDATADPTGVFIFRLEPAEIANRALPGPPSQGPRRVVYLIDLTRPGGMFLAREFLMRDGDTLYVTAAPFTRWMKILQSVAPFVTFTGSVKALATYRPN